jgi:DNA repair photolyase
MFRRIYAPRGRAQEYCHLAINIYDSCPHGCTYCYARAMAKRFGRPWGNTVHPYPGIVEDTKRDMAKLGPAGKKVMLCFTCDPYPNGFDSTATREVIRAIKEGGNHVQILTKGDETAQRDFDLLDGNDSFGITLSAACNLIEEHAATHYVREENLKAAYLAGIKTWISCEPIFEPRHIFSSIREMDFVDMWRFGKMNHQKSLINWNVYGHRVEELCKLYGRNYYIKNDLRKEMEVADGHRS